VSPADRLADRDSPHRSYRRTYGKVQAANPGRWLTWDEAYDTLLGACRDGTAVGRRDELVLRFGLMAMRLAEISGLVVGNLARLPTITWTGKGHRPRRATAGRAMCVLLRHWLDDYRDPGSASPVICRKVLGAARQGGAKRIDWGQLVSPRQLYVVVTTRAREAGLGHVAPHDLRRSAAGILHTAVTAEGPIISICWISSGCSGTPTRPPPCGPTSSP
jgi:integrase